MTLEGTFLMIPTLILWQNGRYVFQKPDLALSESVPNDVKNYFKFCAVFDFKY